jgi:hypothetical protein
MNNFSNSLAGGLPMYSLFAQQAEPRWLEFFSNDHSLALMIPIAFILVYGIVAITRTLLRHRERMAMIERGMNPHYPPAHGDQQEPGIPHESL